MALALTILITLLFSCREHPSIFLVCRQDLVFTCVQILLDAHCTAAGVQENIWYEPLVMKTSGTSFGEEQRNKGRFLMVLLAGSDSP